MYYNRSMLKKWKLPLKKKKLKWLKFCMTFQISLWTWSEEETVRWLSLQTLGPSSSIQITLVGVIWDLEVKYRVNKRCVTLGWRLIVYVGGFDIECISGKIEPLHWAKAEGRTKLSTNIQNPSKWILYNILSFSRWREISLKKG